MKEKIEKIPKPYRILVLGDYKANTGFGIVMNNLIPRIAGLLKDKWEFDVCAVNYFGPPFQETENVFVFSGLNLSMTGINPSASRDEFGRSAFLRVLYQANADVPGVNEHPSELGYDGIFIIADAPGICQMVPLLENIKREFKQKNKKNFKSIFYFPVDNDLIPSFVKDLEFFDVLVTYNEYSRAAVLKLKPELKGKIRIIPHGIDLDQFTPIYDQDQKRQFRKDYFGDNADKFIVINLNRNQPRKDIPCTIMGFLEFHKVYPDTFLYLHMNPIDPKGWDLRMVLEQVGLTEGIDYMFPPMEVQNHGTDGDTLNKIYNACDVYLTTTLGEGWGLGVTEAMAAGIPVMAPHHTSFIEIGKNGARIYPLLNLYPYCGAFDSVMRLQCDYVEVADTLTDVLDHIRKKDNQLLCKLDSANQYINTLDWDVIAGKWADIILKTL